MSSGSLVTPFQAVKALEPQNFQGITMSPAVIAEESLSLSPRRFE
ncbi:hypothetical protein SAMN05216555_12414 [Arthrobacter cupressi]|uniref:Uncharacterized protein n=1 Tax=Arthrobacter cupressi TaxID=1045773 RepID=A0A1G8YDJ9_9MICC|nr:hypothetical protein [Arthrobacter cupressi]SDK00918.1 hypothetical protein SAMN05216555_12414 [Arthrobacter cupressi]